GLPSRNRALDAVAREAAHWQLRDLLLQLDLESGTARAHPVSKPATAPGRIRLSLADAPLAPGHANSRRTETVDRTLERLMPLVSPITGLVSDLREVPSAGAPVYVATPSIAPRDPSRPRAISGGKGATDPHARASALAEALEHYSGCFTGREP